MDDPNRLRGHSKSTPLPLSPGNQLIQELTSLGEVCKALQDLNFLDIDDLKNIINLEAKEIADILNVSVKKVTPEKFKDRVNLTLRRIEPVEGEFFFSIRSLVSDSYILYHYGYNR